MSDTGQELHDALNMARRTLTILEEQAAGHTTLTIPARLVLELEEKRKDVARLETQIRSAATGTPGSGLPHNLPRRAEFVGREAYKTRVHEALRSRSYLVSVEGIGGIGKTSLALEVAYECLQGGIGISSRPDTARFDGVIWASARDRDLTLDEVLDAVARTLDYPGIAQKPQDEKREGVVRLLRSGAYLLLIDNFETITDVAVAEFLQDLPEPSKALVTTRERKLERAWTIALKGLEESEALSLIRTEGRRIGMQALEQAEDAVLLPLYQATGGAPLALKWAVGQIKQPGQSLDTVLAALYGAQGNIFDHIFARSWEMLTTEARQVLVTMPFFATSASRQTIAAATDIHHFILDQALVQLLEMSLAEVNDTLDAAERRYIIHPLTRAFSSTCLNQRPEDMSVIFRRLALYFTDFVNCHGGKEWNQEGFTQLDSELANILAILQLCWHRDEYDLAVSILGNLQYYLVVRGYWNEAITLAQQAILVAEERQDEKSAASFKTWAISSILRYRGELDQAEDLLIQAIEIYDRLGYEPELMWAKRNLGRVYLDFGDLDRAEVLLRECLMYASRCNNLNLFVEITYNLAWILLDRNDLDAAWDLCIGALDDARKLDNPAHLTGLLNTLGQVALHRSDLEEAARFGLEALEQVRRFGRMVSLAFNLCWVAEVEIRQKKFESARHRLTEALEYYRRLAIPARIEEVEALLTQLNQEHFLPKPF